MANGRRTRGDKLGRDSAASHTVGLIGECLYGDLAGLEVAVDIRPGHPPDFPDGTEVKASNELTWGDDPRWNIRISTVRSGFREDGENDRWPSWRYAFVLVNPDFWKARLVAYIVPAAGVATFEVRDWGRRLVPAWSPSLSRLTAYYGSSDCRLCGHRRERAYSLPPPRQGALF